MYLKYPIFLASSIPLLGPFIVFSFIIFVASFGLAINLNTNADLEFINKDLIFTLPLLVYLGLVILFSLFLGVIKARILPKIKKSMPIELHVLLDSPFFSS